MVDRDREKPKSVAANPGNRVKQRDRIAAAGYRDHDARNGCGGERLYEGRKVVASRVVCQQVAAARASRNDAAVCPLARG